MKVSRSVSYAVAILLRIASDTQAKPLTAASIAKGSKFPPRFLYRVLRKLVDAGLLGGTSGPGGGYHLARPANKINLLEVVEAVEGPIEADGLTAISPNHTQAIQHINDTCAQQMEAFRKRLARIRLSKLLSLEATEPKQQATPKKAKTAKKKSTKKAVKKKSTKQKKTAKKAAKRKSARKKSSASQVIESPESA